MEVMLAGIWYWGGVQFAVSDAGLDFAWGGIWLLLAEVGGMVGRGRCVRVFFSRRLGLEGRPRGCWG